MQGAGWLLAFLDTAYVGQAIDDTQRRGCAPSSRTPATVALRCSLITSLFSRFNAQGPKLEQALRSLLEKGAITVWYWGHEHECMH